MKSLLKSKSSTLVDSILKEGASELVFTYPLSKFSNVNQLQKYIRDNAIDTDPDDDDEEDAYSYNYNIRSIKLIPYNHVATDKKAIMDEMLDKADKWDGLLVTTFNKEWIVAGWIPS